MGHDTANLQAKSVNDLLREGVAAAKSGQRERARELLMRVVEQDERNAPAWLWLSSVVDGLDDREVCLENVLALDPDNDAARNGLALLRQQELDRLLREGVAAAKSGQRERARELLMRVVEQDERNAPAWLWLSGVVDGLDDREVCLENVLALDPDNAAARKGLAWVQQQKGDEDSLAQNVATEPELPPTDSVPGSPMVVRTRMPVSPAAAVLHEDFASRRPPPEPEPEPLLSVTSDEFDDEYLCPYCAAQTKPDDRKCKACGGSLWIKFRKQEKRSRLLWILLAIQAFSTFLLGVAPLVLVIYAGLRVGVMDTWTLLRAYFGLSTSLSPDVVNAAFAVVPRFVLLLLAIPFIFSLVVLIGLYLRWKPIYYLFLVDAVWGLISALASLFLIQNIVACVIGVVMAMLRLFMIFQLGDDFQVEERRILLQVDRGLGSGTDLWIRGNFYAKQKMWAMAAIHLRGASGLLLNRPDCNVALAVAYIRLKRYDRAAQALAAARRISPDNPQVEELETLLDDLRSAGHAGSSA